MTKKYSFVLITVIVFIVFVEFTIQVFKVDLAVMKPLFYFAEGDSSYVWDEEPKEVFESSNNSEILYRAIKKTKVYCLRCTHPKETEYRENLITTSDVPGRIVFNQPRNPAKTIYWVGGSFSFGISVNDEHTIQNQLQSYFNKKKKSVKIIDSSASAYNMPNKISVMKDLVDKLGTPDLFIFQDTNRGRRAFIHTEPDHARHFKNNPELYLENFPNYFNLSSHEFLVKSVASYRLLIAFSVWLYYYPLIDQCSEIEDKNTFYRCIQNSGNFEIEPYKDLGEYSYSSKEKRIRKFVNTYNIPTIIFNPLDTNCKMKSTPYEIKKENGFFRLTICNDRPEDEEYNFIHPPSYVYLWYGEAFKQAFDEILTKIVK